MHTDPYATRETAAFAVTRDGTEYFWSNNYNGCLNWLHRNVPYSWHHAMKYEGWAIKPLT